MWNMNGPRRVYRYCRFCFQVVAPRIASIMPVAVSPIFIVEVSIAAIVVSWWLGFKAIGVRLSCKCDGCCSNAWYC